MRRIPHSRFVVTADENHATVFRVATCLGAGGAPRPALVERCCRERAPDEPDEPYANAIVDEVLLALRDTQAPSVVVSTTPRIHGCLRALMDRVVLAGATVCEIDRDLSGLSTPRLRDALLHDALL